MSEILKDGESISGLIDALASTDPAVRQASRERLVEVGGADVTRELVLELSDSREHVRWEAAKALSAIGDPVAGPALMHALEDENEDVRWLAGEALIRLGDAGLLIVLNGLTKRAISHSYCKSAHHVIHDLKKLGHTDLLGPVLDALNSSEPGVTAPPAAYAALRSLKGDND